MLVSQHTSQFLCVVLVLELLVLLESPNLVCKDEPDLAEVVSAELHAHAHQFNFGKAEQVVANLVADHLAVELRIRMHQFLLLVYRVMLPFLLFGQVGLPEKGSSWVSLKSEANGLPEAFFGSWEQLDLINGEPVGVIWVLSKLFFRFSQAQNLLKRSLVWV